MDQSITLRTIRYENEASRWIDCHSSSSNRIGEAITGLEWVLARNPEIGERLNSEHWVYVQSEDKYARTPELWVVYAFDEDQVQIFGICTNQLEH